MTLANHAPLHPFAFGTMQWGGTADETAARALFDTCRAAGIQHFDTAVSYTDGQSERLLGQFAKGNRDNLFVATKLGYTGGASAQNIAKQFDISRRQLDMYQIDLLYLHRFDPDTPLDETFEALAQLQSDGAIRYIGVSNFAAWQVMKAQAVCARIGTRIDAIQPMYNLVKRQAEVELLPMALDQGITTLPYSPLGGGLLTGKYDSGGTGRLSTDARYAARYAPAEMHAAATALGKLAQDIGQHPATLAAAWVAAHPSAPIPLLSARSSAQLQPSLAALTFEMDADLYARLGALFPSPPPATDRIEEA